MSDIVSKKTRSRMMSNIRSKDTKPEMIVRRYLHRNGFRYRLHANNLPGKPDIVLPKYKTVIFVHGCFWHRHEGCKFATTPKSNRTFWMNKLELNKSRDIKRLEMIHSMGWKTITVWECGLRTTADDTLSKLTDLIRTMETFHRELS